jgi:hypothetical protein
VHPSDFLQGREHILDVEKLRPDKFRTFLVHNHLPAPEFEGPYGVIVAVKPLALQGKKHRPFRRIAGVRGDGTCMLYCFSQVSG